MTPKRVLTAALLAFVAASLAWIVVKEVRGGSGATPESPPAAQAPSVATPGEGGDSKTPPAPPKVVATFFHTNVRCRDCRAIEEYAKEAVETSFPEAMRDGRLEWREINVDDAGNERFIREFSLVAATVVLERFEGGRRSEWKNLPRVWELAHDKDAFLEYVKAEAAPYVEAASR